MNRQRYGTVAIALHWLSALLVVVLLLLGWRMAELPEGPIRREPFTLHKSLGLTVFLLTCCRLLVRRRRPPPPLPDTLSAWRRAAATGMHRALYALLALQPVLGYLSTSFTRHSTKFWFIPLPKWAEENPPVNEFFSDLHAGCGMLLAICIAIHVGGALTHLLTPGDTIVRRMWPWSWRRRPNGVL
jgi:cytochrome b561